MTVSPRQRRALRKRAGKDAWRPSPVFGGVKRSGADIYSRYPPADEAAGGACAVAAFGRLRLRRAGFCRFFEAPVGFGAFGAVLEQAVAEYGAGEARPREGAAWHTANALKWPRNIAPLPPPSWVPELNPVENIRQYLPRTWLSNRVFDT